MADIETTLLRNTMDIVGTANGTARRMIAVLNEAEKRAVRRLERRLSSGSGKLTLTRERLLLREIAGTLDRLNGKIEPILGEARAEVIRADYQSVSRALAREIGLPTSAVPSRIPVAQLNALLRAPVGGRTVEEWVSRLPRNLTRGIRRELTQARIAGDGIDAITRRIRHQFGLSRRGATVLARTALLQASADARNAVYDRHAEDIDEFIYLATLDERTCPICAPYDSQRAEKRDELPDVPQHPQCRCVLRPHIRGVERPERPVIREAESHTVHHRDGTTSTRWRPTRVTHERMTYNQFFRSQPADWQRRVLGPRRFELWRSGDVRLGEFARADHVLTLDELKRSLGVSA